jgi:DNA polymerase-3 subunit beta
VKLTAQRDALLAGIQCAAGGIPSKDIRPVLKNYKATADADGTLTLSASDLELGVRVLVAGVTVSEPGEALWPAGRTAAILRETSASDVTISGGVEGLNIDCDGATFDMPGEDPALFPDIPTFNEDRYHLIASDVLRQMIRRTAFAAATGETARFAMTGVLFELDGDTVRLVATDGRRLAKCEGKGKSHGGHETSKASPPLVPVKALHLLEKNLGGDGGGDVKVCFRANEVLFATDTATVYSRLVDGRFPDYRQVFPKKAAAGEATFTVERLCQAIRQAAIMADDESRRVSFAFGDGRVVMDAQGAMTGKGRVECACAWTGDKGVTTSLNPAYLLDILKVLDDGASVVVRLIDGAAPVEVRLEGDDSARYLVVPLA